MRRKISVFLHPETSTPMDLRLSLVCRTHVPLPLLAQMSPASSSFFFALRTVPLETLKRRARSDSLGNRPSGLYFPLLISSRSVL